MKNALSRRELLKGAAGALSWLAVDGGPALGVPAADRARLGPESGPVDSAAGRGFRGEPDGSIEPLDSTGGVYLPPRGRGYQKFSYGFPEPSVVVGGLALAFRLHTFENTYGLDRDLMKVSRDGDDLLLECTGLVGAGGQVKVPGTLRSRIRRNGEFTEWDVRATMDRPIKSVASIVRGVPRGKVAIGTTDFRDPGDDELLYGYPWGAARQARGTDTPLAVIETTSDGCFFLSALMEEVRANRLYLQPGPDGYRVELIYEQPGWDRSRVLEGGRWRAGRTGSAEEAFRRHVAHVERAFDLPAWEARTDVPEWFREVELVLSIHGMHWTGYIFNDFQRALEILRWTATQISPRRVMVFLPAWDGRYYWSYPAYEVDRRLGGEDGFRTLIREGQKLGYHFVPMFGLNAANVALPDYRQFAEASTREIDGNTFPLAWVDWDNDRHNEGWGRYMNVGVDVWRRWIRDSVTRILDRYGADGYFLDIAGGWVDNTQADMHEGVKRLVGELRETHPHALAVGEFSYDALLGVLPVYQVFPSPGYPPAFERYCRTFSHLSHPAPGRGSSGVHEWGFGRFDPDTLSLSPHEIPTITVVDDTFERHRDVMAAIIRRAKGRGAR